MKMMLRNGQGDIRLAVSACLAGQKVRYDGGDRYEADIMQDLSHCFSLLTICPEVGIGLPVPRPPIQLQQFGKYGDIYLRSIESGEDYTDRMQTLAGQTIDEHAGIGGYVFKARSPSCAVHDAEIINPDSDMVHAGPGLFAREVMSAMPLLPVADETGLRDRRARHRFIEQVYLYSRWISCVENGARREAIREFHSVHRLNVLAYDEYVVLQLDDLVEDDAIDDVVSLAQEYILLFMSAMESEHAPDYRRVLDSLLGSMAELREAEGSDEVRNLRKLAAENMDCLEYLVSGIAALFEKYRLKMPDCYFLSPYQADFEVRYKQAGPE